MTKMKCAYLALLAVVLSPIAANADPILAGSTTGPDSSFSINFNFTNDSSAEDIVSLSLDGSTATAFPILWDSIGSLGGQTANVSGVDTQLVTFLFTSIWSSGEGFSLTGVDPDGDPGPVGVTIFDMIGVQVSVLFSGGGSALYSFVDDPATGAGLVLQAVSVPEPGTLALLGIGLMGMGFSRRRKV